MNIDTFFFCFFLLFILTIKKSLHKALSMYVMGNNIHIPPFMQKNDLNVYLKLI